MEDDGICNTRLDLGLGLMSGGDQSLSNHKKMMMNKQQQQQPNSGGLVSDRFSFTIIPKKEAINVEAEAASSSPAASSEDHLIFSLGKTNNGTETTTDQRERNRDRERKKLRLSKEQSSLLEESFKLHNTLNPAQKQALAHQLNLKTRQVEVWFQNRRARTKLKQTEVDCEFLKKCCEKLSEENRRLKKELTEIRSLKVIGPSQLYIQLPKAAKLSICPSCDKLQSRSAAANATANAAASPAVPLPLSTLVEPTSNHRPQ